MRIGEFSISPAHYNDIPQGILEGDKTILEFGCANGLNQLICNYRDFFIENNRKGNYLGVDLFDYREEYLEIVVGDIRSFDYPDTFDIVLALHVLEHIEFKYWKETIDRLKQYVAPQGYLIIGTPSDEPAGTNEGHIVFNITPDTFFEFLPTAEITKIKKAPAFISDGESFGWALLRYVKRRITRHPYVRRYHRLLVIWRNETRQKTD